MKTTTIIIHIDDAMAAREAPDKAGIPNAISNLREALAAPLKVTATMTTPKPKRARKPRAAKPSAPAKPAKARPAKMAPEDAKAAVLAYVTAHPGCRSQDIPGVPASQRKYALRTLVKEKAIAQAGKAGGARFAVPSVEHNGQTLRKVVKVRDAATKAPKREVVPEAQA